MAYPIRQHEILHAELSLVNFDLPNIPNRFASSNKHTNIIYHLRWNMHININKLQ